MKERLTEYQYRSLFEDLMQEVGGNRESRLVFEQELFDAIPLPILFNDSDGSFLGANRALEEFLGVDRAKILQYGVYHFLAPGHEEEYRNKDAELLEKGGRDSFEGLVITDDGRERDVVFTRATIHNRSGQVIGLIVTLFDFSELKKVRSSLGEIELQKQAILDGFPGTMALLDCNLEVIWSNKSDLEQSGVGVAQHGGSRCYQLLLNSTQACEDCIVRRSIQSGRIEYGTVAVASPGDGEDETRYFELVATPVKDAEEKVRSVVAISRDVTSKIKLEKHVRHSQKMEAIGALAGGIAHDFNNVLTPIIGHAEIMRFRVRQSGLQDKYLESSIEEILKAAKRAKSLVNQILTFSRSQEQNSVPLFVHPIIKEAIGLVKVGLPRTIEIRQEIDKECGQVLIDPVQLHQVLMNLCTNSFHAMEGRVGTLTIRLSSTEEDSSGRKWVVLSVLDTGAGIEPAVLPRIFEPYFTTKDKSRGTGMGLAMVHGIVTRHGGRIEVKSEVGVGTTFDIYLPVAESASSVESVLAVVPPVGGTEHVLLVEDEEQVQEVVTSILQGLGYRVTSCRASHEALQLFREAPHEFDLLITDLTMPVMTGADLAEQIHKIRPGLPIVLSTGYSDQITPDVLHRSGTDNYFLKPVTLQGLAQVVRNALDRERGVQMNKDS